MRASPKNLKDITIWSLRPKNSKHMTTQWQIRMRKDLAAANAGDGMCMAVWQSFLSKITVLPASKLPKYGIFLTAAAAREITRAIDDLLPISYSETSFLWRDL